MPRDYRRNHVLSKKQIGYWVDETAEPPGVHMYDIVRGRKRLASAGGRRPFSFAIANELYITEVDGTRATGTENWLGQLEGSLAKLIAQLHAREQISLTAQDLFQALMGVVALECRPRHNLNLVRELIERDAGIRAAASANPERPAMRIALENMAHLVNELALRYWPVEMTIAYADGDWLLSDRPYIAADGLSHRLAILTNKVMLGYRRSGSGVPVYQYRDAPPGFVRCVNDMTAEQAREWIVAKSEAQLDEFIPVFATPAWQAKRAEDAPQLEPIRFLSSGLSLRPGPTPS